MEDIYDIGCEVKALSNNVAVMASLFSADMEKVSHVIDMPTDQTMHWALHSVIYTLDQIADKLFDLDSTSKNEKGVRS